MWFHRTMLTMICTFNLTATQQLIFSGSDLKSKIKTELMLPLLFTISEKRICFTDMAWDLITNLSKLVILTTNKLPPNAHTNKIRYRKMMRKRKAITAYNFHLNSNMPTIRFNFAASRLTVLTVTIKYSTLLLSAESQSPKLLWIAISMLFWLTKIDCLKQLL